MTDTPKIRLRDVCKSFGPKHVLRGLNLDVGVGESVVVIGGSGTGKSVMLKCSRGLLQADSGSIEIDGREVAGLGGRELGATTLSITHDMASARKIAHRIAMLYRGEIIWAGPVSDIDSSHNEYVEQFINGLAEGPIQMEVLKT